MVCGTTDLRYLAFEYFFLLYFLENLLDGLCARIRWESFGHCSWDLSASSLSSLSVACFVCSSLSSNLCFHSFDFSFVSFTSCFIKPLPSSIRSALPPWLSFPDIMPATSLGHVSCCCVSISFSVLAFVEFWCVARLAWPAARSPDESFLHTRVCRLGFICYWGVVLGAR